MNSKKTPIRACGQSSIASSFFFSRSSHSAKDFKEDTIDKDSKKNSGSRISLSDFLDRKLQKSSALSKTVQEKSRPFSSLVGTKEVVQSAGGQSRDKKEGEGVVQKKKEGEGEGSGILDKVVFEQFKPGVTEKVDCTGPSSICEEGAPSTDDEVQNSRKRKNPFENGNEHRTRKPYIVLGDDPRVKQNDSKPKQRGRRDQPTSNKKQRPLYNHYANGCGWWDGDMECVDDEEVGYGEVWEGVGSTTLGEIINWH